MRPMLLATDRPVRALAWPDYRDPASLHALIGLCPALAERGDTALVLRWDRAVDPPRAEAVNALQSAAAELPGDHSPPVVLLDDPLPSGRWPALAAALHGVLLPERSPEPQRAELLFGLGLPLIADARALRALDAPRPRAELLPGMWQDIRRERLRPTDRPTGRGPDYVGVGAAKAGTTWWSQVIEHHPCVPPNRLGAKELHGLTHFGWRSPSPEQIRTYREAFAAHPHERCGEFTPLYLGHPLAIDALADAAPDTRVLILLRDPVDRAVSMLNQLHLARDAWLGLHGRRARVLRDYSWFPEAVDLGRLVAGMRRVRARFPPERVLVLQYEQLRADPEAGYARTMRWLELEPSADPPLRRAAHRQPYHIPRPTVEGRSRLAAWMAADCQQLLRLCPELDADLWPSATGYGADTETA